MILRALNQILSEEIDTQRADYLIKMSFMGLYNEELRDLLSEDDTNLLLIKLKIFELSSRGIMI
jgi:hypothetical protein